MTESAFLTGFDESIQQAMEDWHVPGCAVLLICGDETPLRRGYGWRDIDKQLPVNAETLFGIASNTKAFTGTALALLAERGLIRLDAPLRTYLPEFRLSDETIARQVTPRDLVAHRTGLPRHDGLWYLSKLNRAEMFERLAHLQLSRGLRELYQYNNLMFMVAGVLVERVTGLTWEDFMQQEFLNPLGMTHSNFSAEDMREAENVAHPYGRIHNATQKIPFCNLDAVGPCGSINSCVADLKRWLRFHLSGGLTATGQRLLAPGSLLETYRPTTPIPYGAASFTEFPEFGASAYGMGWSLRSYRDRRALMHTGGIDGYSSLVSWMPDERVAVAVLSNLDDTDFPVFPIFELYDRALGLDRIPWSQVYKARQAVNQQAARLGSERLAARRKHNAPASFPQAAYEGEYWHPGYGLLCLERQGDRLMMRYNGRNVPLTHQHFDVFVAEDPDSDFRILVQFHLDEDGELSGLSARLEPAVEPQRFERLPEPLATDQLTGLAGRYTPETTEIQVKLEDGRAYSVPARFRSFEVVARPDGSLALQISGDPQRELVRVRGWQFRVPGAPSERVEFEQPDGAEPILIFTQDGSSFLATRKD